MSDLRIQVAYAGYGKRCHGCRKVGYNTEFRVWKGDELVRNLRVCKECADKSVETELTLPQEDNPLIGKEVKRRIKKSRELEQDLAKKLSGRAQPASGSSRLPGFKGDVRKVGSWRVEHKYTNSAKSWTLKLEDLAKIVTLAMEADEYPALVVEFLRVHESFAIVPLSLFLEMVHENDQHTGPARRRRG